MDSVKDDREPHQIHYDNQVEWHKEFTSGYINAYAYAESYINASISYIYTGSDNKIFIEDYLKKTPIHNRVDNLIRYLENIDEKAHKLMCEVKPKYKTIIKYRNYLSHNILDKSNHNKKRYGIKSIWLKDPATSISKPYPIADLRSKLKKFEQDDKYEILLIFTIVMEKFDAVLNNAPPQDNELDS